MFFFSFHEESRHHLFFECDISSQVWSFFISRMHLVSPQGFEEVSRWLKAPSRDSNVTLIVRLIFKQFCT